MLDEREAELEKLEARSVGRQSVAGLSMRNVLNNASAAKPVTKRHNPARARRQASESSADVGSVKS